jgi:hypothetical protein
MSELDTKCYGLAQSILTIDRGMPWVEATRLREDLLGELETSFSRLLDDTADHLSVAVRTITAVAGFDASRAVSMARRLNYPGRRDQAIGAVVRAYLERDPIAFDLEWLLDVVPQIADAADVRGAVIVEMCRSLSRTGLPAPKGLRWRFRQVIEALPDPSDRAEAWAWASGWLIQLSDPRASELVDLAEEACFALDLPWRLYECALSIVAILAPRSRERAEGILERARSAAAQGPGHDPFFSRLYGDAVAVAVTALPVDTAAASRKGVESIRALVRPIPSLAIRAQIGGQLAWRLHAGGEPALAAEVLAEAEQLFGQLKDGYARLVTTLWLAPMLAEHDFDDFAEWLDGMPRTYRDRSVWAALMARLGKVPPGLSVDIDSFCGGADPDDFKRAIELANLLKADHQIGGAVQFIATVALNSSCPPKTLNRLADQIDETASQRLLHPEGIQHQGWKVVCAIESARLRCAAARAKTDPKACSDVLDQARAIPNIADRVFVLGWLGRDLADFAPALSKKSVDEGEHLIAALPAVIDRIARGQSLAEARARQDDTQLASELIRRAWDEAKDSGYDSAQTVDRLIEAADAIDPSLASSLTTLMDSGLHRYSAEQRNRAHALRRRPADVAPLDGWWEAPILARAATMSVRAIYEGRGQAARQETVGSWLTYVSCGVAPTVFPVVTWAAECGRLGSWRAETRQEMFQASAAAAEFVWRLGVTLLQSDGESPSGHSSGRLAGNLEVFGVGERSRALEAIGRWMAECVQEYLWIVDKFFGPDDVDLLKLVPENITVRVVTALVNQKIGNSPIPQRNLQASYEAAWRRIAGFDPPPTTVTLLGTKAGKTPIHDRCLITRDAGLTIGTSQNGLGRSDTETNRLNGPEAELKRSFVSRWLVDARPIVDEQPLLVVQFVLGG